MEPGLVPGSDIKGEHQAQEPHYNHRRVEDDRPDPRFPFDPRAVLGRAHWRLVMIDIETRQQEQASKPEDHEGDVRRLHPQIGRAKEAVEVAHLSPFTSAIRRSTWAIGVSWRMP